MSYYTTIRDLAHIALSGLAVVTIGALAFCKPPNNRHKFVKITGYRVVRQYGEAQLCREITAVKCVNCAASDGTGAYHIIHDNATWEIRKRVPTHKEHCTYACEYVGYFASHTHPFGGERSGCYKNYTEDELFKFLETIDISTPVLTEDAFVACPSNTDDTLAWGTMSIFVM